MNVAQNFKDAYVALNPGSLDVESFYYVPRPNPPLKSLQQMLELSENPVKAFVGGQAGVGKSAELRVLSQQLSI